MSNLLWKHFIQDDVESFRRLLETSSYNARPSAQKGHSSGYAQGAGAHIGSPGSLSTSPNLVKSRKSAGGGSNTNVTRASLNGKDSNGMTILHHAVSSKLEKAAEFATLLVEHPLIDLYAADEENGWTALHRAFYFGNITAARQIIARDSEDAFAGHVHGTSGQQPGRIIKIKDKEGNAPFELYDATIKERLKHHEGANRLLNETGSYDGDEEDGVHYADNENMDVEASTTLVRPTNKLKGDDVFAFGSNKNVTLGFRDGDDRQFPDRVTMRRPEHLVARLHAEQEESRRAARLAVDASLPDTSASGQKATGLDLPVIIRSIPIAIQDVQMARFHTAIVTTDPESNLYMCGHGQGGRLGIGNEATQFQPAPVQGGGLAHKKVAAVALGQSHTLCITSHGEIFSWGNNNFGQLGYALPQAKRDEEPMQLVPRQIYGPLKRETIVGIAASRIHSVAHTSHSLYAFGKNEGQLGVVNADSRTLEIQVIPRKITASFLTKAIISVAAIDKATVCLLENHEVYVFANYGYARITFSLDGFSNSFLQASFTATKHEKTPNRISKITAGGDTIGAMSSGGEIFTVTVNTNSETNQATTASTTNPAKIRNSLSQPNKMWSARKEHMYARDVSVDQDGSIILGTDAGSVWRRVKRARIKDPATPATDQSKAREHKFLRVPGLTRVVAVRASAHGAYSAIRKDFEVTKAEVIIDEPTLWKDMVPLLPFHALLAQEDSDDENPLPRFWRQPGQAEVMRERLLQFKDMEAKLGEIVTQAEMSDQAYDVDICTTVSDVALPAHKFVLAARSPLLRRALAEYRSTGAYELPETLHIESTGSRLRIIFQGLDFLTIMNFVLYSYTDSLVDFWNLTRRYPKEAYRFRQIRAELMKVASRLELKQLEPAVRQMISPKRSLAYDMEAAMKAPSFFADADVVVQLEDANVKVHSTIMCQRCPFFESMFKGRAGGRWMEDRRAQLQDETDLVPIDLKHISSHIFKLVLRHIYCDLEEDLFDNVVSEDFNDNLALSELLDLVIEVMGVADELMMDRLSSICQKIVGRYVNTRNACKLLEAIEQFSVGRLKKALLEYICLNLEALMVNGTLDELSPELAYEVDEAVSTVQLECEPVSRSLLSDEALEQRYPGLGERREADKKVKLARLRHAEFDLNSRSLSISDFGSFVPKTPPSGVHGSFGRRASNHDHQHPMPSLTAPSPASRPTPVADTDDLMFGDLSDGEDNKPSRSAKKPVMARSPAAASPTVGSSPVPKSPALGASKPWVIQPSTPAKVNLKDVMAQTSSQGPTPQSPPLRPQPFKSASTPLAKMSQKERKMMSQQQASQPEQSEPSGLSIAFKDVVRAKTPQLTMRQTVAKRAPSDSQGPPTSPMNRKASAQGLPSRTPPMNPTKSSNPWSSPLRPANASPLPAPPPMTLSPPAVATPSPIPPVRSIRHTPVAVASPAALSLADIVSEEQAYKTQLKEAVAPRKLDEIQQEQAFLADWDRMVAEYQAQEAAQNAPAPSSRGGKKGGRRGRGSRGKGGRGGKGGGEGAGGQQQLQQSQAGPA